MSGFEITGAVAAAEQLAEAAFKTIKLVKSIADQIQDGPDQIQQKIQRLEGLASLAKQIQNKKPLQTEDIGKILTRCECHVQSLQNLLQKISFDCHDTIQKKTWRAISGLKQQANISKLFDDLDHEYNSLNTHINLHILAIAGDIRTRYNSIDTKLNAIANSSPDSLKCLQALFITDPATDRAKLINSKGELVEGTCDWIAQKKEFVEWKDSDGGLLWISGGPGLGKTMLSIYLIEYLSVCFLSSGDAGSHYSTYFFCDANDNTRNNAVAIIRGILFQLVEQKKELIRHILPSYEVQREQLFSQNSFEAVWEFFLAMMNDLGDSQAICILDGLDECEPTSLELLLKNLKNITSTSPRLKIIILSREYPQIFGASLGQFPRIRLDPDAKIEVNRGLEQYISTRVAELSESKQYTTQLANHVKECLMEKSAGTYLWVSFTVKDLQTMEIPEVEESLNQFPKGLDALYERLLQQIESTQRGLILDILRWCTFAVRPLSLNELAAALEIKPTGLLDSVTILRGKLAYCGHFLSISDDTVTLVHHSAYDFLTRQIPSPETMPWFSLSNVELEQSKLASECISHFCDVYCRDKDAFQIETVDGYHERKLRYHFCYYASRQWTEHLKHSGERGDEIITEHPKFFHDKSEILDLWMKSVDVRRRTRPTKLSRRKELYDYKLLNGQAELAANYGLTALMKKVVEKEGSWRYLKRLFAQAPGSPHLQIAAEKGHVPILEMLLKNKARINSKDSLGQTALYCAAEYGHLPAVTILVENGAHIDCETRDQDTALDVAVERGHYKTVHYLLTCGANVNGAKKATAATCPLRKAVFCDRPELVKLLLEWGADDRLGTKDFECYFAPKLSVFIGYFAEKFCTIPSHFRDKVDFGKATALHLACRRGDLSAIHTLLDPKWSLDVNRQDEDGNTALHWAAMKGQLQAMRLLLMKPGIDPKLLNHWGLSPFQLALFHCQSHVVEYLYMTRNWDISPPEPNEKCRLDAIHIVILGDYFSEQIRRMLVRLVVEFGVDPELRTPRANCLDNKWHSHHLPRRHDGYRRSPADLTPEDFCHETPLSLAIQRGDMGIVEFFLGCCNIDPNAPCRGCDGATPLHVAAQSLRERIVWQLIMKWNANVNCLDNYQRTPLHLVVGALVHCRTGTDGRKFRRESRNAIIRDLISASAQTSAMDANGCTPRDLFVSNKSFEDGWGHTDRGDEFDRIIRS